MQNNLSERVAHLEQLMVSRVSAHQQASVQFATVLVANLMIINSGALFALSSMFERISKYDPQNLASWAAGSFVLGIVLATICGSSAYHNFLALAQHESHEGTESIFDEKYPEATSGLPEVDEWRNKTQKSQKHYERMVHVSLWSGNVSGILSLISFVIGCYYASQVAFRV